MADPKTITPSDPIKLSQFWGVDAHFHDYRIDDASVDFQDLMVIVSVKRAAAVEDEVYPLSTRMKQRNEELNDLGEALSDLTKIQSTFASDASGSTRATQAISDETYNTLKKVWGDENGNIDFSNQCMLKYEVEEWVQRVKSKIDNLNNETETDMTRLESLVDYRDEAYSTASDLMSEVSDTRSNLIGNL
jgi:Ribonuclease G/E